VSDTLLGIDLGERRIGVAVGGPDGARGIGTIRRAADPGRDAEVLARLAAEHRATGLVVGLPLNADGSEGRQAELTRAWVDAVAPLLGMPVALRDERWTSLNAEASLGRPRRGRSGGPPSAASRNRRRAQIDREAARRILQAELDERADRAGTAR
jgi:putative Holliday junction resolvase